MSSVRVVLVLGRIAFDGYRRLLRQRGVDLPTMDFFHGACYTSPSSLPALVASYHPSRQNTNTGRLTNAMLDDVFGQISALLAQE
jgi:uracil-DNA glycosylase